MRAGSIKVQLLLVGRDVTELENLASELTSQHRIDCRVLMLELAEDAGVELLQKATVVSSG